MGLKINLNGSNFVSEKTRTAFERALQQVPHQQSARHQQQEHQARVSDNGNGDYPVGRSVSSMDELTPRPSTDAEPSPPQVDYQRILKSLEQGLVQSYQHQSETLHVHEQYLNNQAEYSRIFLQLMQQQGNLFTHGLPHSNGGAVSASSTSAAATTRMVLESLARSIEQFHAHQSETLGLHNQFLNQQSEYANAFMDLLQEECQALTSVASAPRASLTGLSEYGRERSLEASVTEAHTSPKGSGNNGDAGAKPRPVNVDRLAEIGGRFSPTLVQPTEPVNGRSRSEATVAQATVDAHEPVSEGIDGEALAQSLLDIVSEKTGYPTDVLELSMDMEADLGIDSIKRVEILGALEDKHPALPEVDADALAELRTLGQVIDYMGARDVVKKNA